MENKDKKIVNGCLYVFILTLPTYLILEFINIMFKIIFRSDGILKEILSYLIIATCLVSVASLILAVSLALFFKVKHIYLKNYNKKVIRVTNKVIKSFKK